MRVQEVEIDNITTLANFIIENGENRIIVESKDFKNSKDLFFFCVEITMKILSIKFGDENNKVNIDYLSLDQLKEIEEILLNAAIQFNIDISDIDFPIEATHIEYVLPESGNNRKTDFKLEDYSMIIRKNNKKYNINFEIIIMN